MISQFLGTFRFIFRSSLASGLTSKCLSNLYDMDRISGLPDELLVKILLFVPTKVAASTMILSKRWEFLWLLLPKLDYSSGKFATLLEFINKNLPLHRAPVIENLRFDFSCSVKPEAFKRWVEIAVSRHVREMEVSCIWNWENIFPDRFYTCSSLVILKLGFVALMDVPSTGCLCSLKTLNLQGLEYANQDSLQQLLSICPALKELSVNIGDGTDENMKEFTISLPSLQSLSLSVSNFWSVDGYVIDTPSLEYFKLEDWNDREHYTVVKDMPCLREAYVVSFDLKSLIGSIKTVKHLTICSEDDVSGEGFVFKQLEHLKLCVCKQDSSNLLGQLLKVSPNLRVLDMCVLEYGHNDAVDDYMGFWNEPSPVPECLLSSLQILSWSRYFGRPQERDIAVYILKNARRLKKATILADTEKDDVPNLKMIKELTLSSRASSICELVFVEDHREYEY